MDVLRFCIESVRQLNYRGTGDGQENLLSATGDSAIEGRRGVRGLSHCLWYSRRIDGDLSHCAICPPRVPADLHPPYHRVCTCGWNMVECAYDPLPRLSARGSFPGAIWTVRDAYRVSQ